VFTYAIGADGSLSELARLPFRGVGPRGLATTPDGRHLYVVEPGFPAGVFAYAIGADGSLSEVAGSPFPAGTAPWFVAVTPDGSHLYAANRDSDNVSAYAIGADGALTALPGSPVAAEANLNGAIAATPDGRHLYVTGYRPDFSGFIAAYAIGADGALSELAGSPFAPAGIPAAVAATPDGRHLYATSPEGVSAYAIGDGGGLSELAGSPFPAAVSHPQDPVNRDPPQPGRWWQRRQPLPVRVKRQQPRQLDGRGHRNRLRGRVHVRDVGPQRIIGRVRDPRRRDHLLLPAVRHSQEGLLGHIHRQRRP
jgi:hypothetical protein